MTLLPRQILCGALALGIITSSGCAQFAPNSPAATPISNQLADYLNTNNSSAILLASSPWGANAQVIADAPYFAASGHTCRQLQVSQANGNPQQYIACKIKDDNWTISRNLQQP